MPKSYLSSGNLFALLLIFGSGSPAAAQEVQPVQASSAADFLNSFGINIHLGAFAYGSLPTIASQLNYTGITHVRDRLGVDTSSLQQLNMLTGVKFDLVDGFYGADGGSDVMGSYLSDLQGVADVLEGIEGPNEPDYFGIYWNGTTGAAAVIAAQQFIHSFIKASPTLNTIPVLCPALSFPASGGMASSIGNLADVCDYATSHSYPENTSLNQWYPAGTFSTTYGFLSVWTGFPDTITAPGRPEFITEGGWDTDTNSDDGVDEVTQAKYYADYLLDAFSQGIARSYMYELVDDSPDPGMTYNESHFGIFHSDGTPKPAATLLANLHALLGGGSVSPSTLSYSLASTSSTSANLHQLLLQKGDGTFVLAAWNEGPMWDSTTQSETPLDPVPVTLTLAAPASIQIFDPIVGTAPQSTASDTTSVAISVPDHPILISIASGQLP